MRDEAREVRWALTDARRLCDGLGLLEGSKPQPGGGLVIRCPSHKDREASCGVTTGPDGTLRARCFACQWGADALGMIATVRGLDVRNRDHFREVLAEGAAIAGLHDLEREILDGKPRPERQRVAPPEKVEERTYPPEETVRSLWATGARVDEDREASGYFVRRRLDPGAVADLNLARVIVAPLPEWAKYGRRSWLETGHRVVVRAFDPGGTARSVRAIRVTDGDSPKRLPPAGHKAAGLAQMNHAAYAMMLRRFVPLQLTVAEGEPDWLSHATLLPDDAVIGIGSGSWSREFAERVPGNTEVLVRTHNDAAGDKYADAVIDSLLGRCKLHRRVAHGNS